MADYILNEGSTALIGLWFKDEKEKNVTPTQLIWRLDDVTLLTNNDATFGPYSAGEIVDDTMENPTSYKHTVSIPDTANIIINPNNGWEEKVMTVKFTYGNSSVGTEEFRYRVKKLSRVIV
jgi:hypothetical protein